MQALDRALFGVRETIPVPWGTLAQAIRPGPGHLIGVIAAPNTGKSALSLAWALAMDQPSLMFSLDTDLATQASRTLAWLTGEDQDRIRDNPGNYADVLKDNADKLPMMIDYPVYADQVDEVCKAFEEFYGGNPKLIVVDNLKDVVRNESYESYRESLRELHRVARKRDAAVLILHHINRKNENAQEGDAAPRLADGQFTMEQDCEFVLGLWQAIVFGEQHVLMIRVLKNRFGKKNTDVGLLFNMDRMSIRERGVGDW